ncbi:hypothetical protein P691DRAFT_761807 [Macrolepiota fuliginosa MF-IS2]|uniref:Uncharacterized protein n=1 Tax=Macrolepiota fuliginosa MF-IS2 TaxID=1400762 RepID=A0A9P6C223_9AGAR|nr:hypothetical protein P691DRAFT_761807 [Macrolepiota fuliginosa MF-IS2]
MLPSSQFYLVISSLRCGNPRQSSFSRTLWLIIAPWLTFLMIILGVLVVIFPGNCLHLVDLAASNFYCHLENVIPEQVTAAVVIGAMAVLIPLEVWTGLLLYRNWDIFGNLSRRDCRLVLTVYLRLIICTLAAVATLISCLLVFGVPQTSGANTLLYATLPVCIAIAFGTQKDLLQAWLFWRSPQPHSSMVFNHGTPITTGTHTRLGTEITGEPTLEAQTQ